MKALIRSKGAPDENNRGAERRAAKVTPAGDSRFGLGTTRYDCKALPGVQNTCEATCT